jgi:chaperone protein EcpD
MRKNMALNTTLPVRHIASAFVLFATALAMVPAHAGVIIGGTRVVYPAQDKEVTIKLENKGAEPALVQAWLDTGDENATPDTVDVPFTLTPPMFRMEPGKGQALRMMYTQEPLAADQETLFWLNVLEVPPKPANAEGRNLLQFAFRNRIKVFFRPRNLPYGASEAPAKLSWRLVAAAAGKQQELEVSNPTPYHVSFSAVALAAGDRTYKKSGAGGAMVAPGASMRFALEGLNTRPAAAEVEFTSISDYGAQIPRKAALLP